MSKSKLNHLYSKSLVNIIELTMLTDTIDLINVITIDLYKDIEYIINNTSLKSIIITHLKVECVLIVLEHILALDMLRYEDHTECIIDPTYGTNILDYASIDIEQLGYNKDSNELVMEILDIVHELVLTKHTTLNRLAIMLDNTMHNIKYTIGKQYAELMTVPINYIRSTDRLVVNMHVYLIHT